jgi:hypothetical protein
MGHSLFHIFQTLFSLGAPLGASLFHTHLDYNNNNNKYASAGQLNSFSHPRALLFYAA